ncbi:YidH family protein [Nocardia tengchongensis]|uniref:YidH family protein n=1 Tax=Nocardia tengchongensis TaxID=2055889 RepID=UPI003684BB0A
MSSEKIADPRAETAVERRVSEPLDYRFSLANERTFLAWIRTALGLLAGGVAVQTLAESFSTWGFRRAIAVACAGLAVVIAAAAYRQWKRVEKAMHQGVELPSSMLVPVLATGVGAIALAAGTAVLVA